MNVCSVSEYFYFIFTFLSFLIWLPVCRFMSITWVISRWPIKLRFGDLQHQRHLISKESLPRFLLLEFIIFIYRLNIKYVLSIDLMHISGRFFGLSCEIKYVRNINGIYFYFIVLLSYPHKGLPHYLILPLQSFCFLFLSSTLNIWCHCAAAP